MGLLPPLWAVHIADAVLSWPWLVGGFALAALLALVASYRVRDEEIPRIALLSAAFFVASSVHLKFGPTSAHLLLNGLVGVVLGWRAPLAILIGVTLQAVLIPHGGFSTIGVNTCTEAIPALCAAALFGTLQRWAWQGAARAALVALSAAVWAGGLVFAAVALWTSPLGEVVQTTGAGLVVSALGPGVERAMALTFHPLTLGLLAVFALACAWGERRMNNAPEFALGLFVGSFTVMFTVALAGAVLLLDGAERWRPFVNVVFLGHLPLAVLEGLVLGCVVGFLARVKPELLGAREAAFVAAGPARPPVLLLALGGLLLSAGVARAHLLEAECGVDLAKKSVRVESWYETGDAPKQATVEVLRDDGSVLAKGPLELVKVGAEEKGVFVFHYARPEALKVVVRAPGGHRAERRLSARELGAASAEAPSGRLAEEVEALRAEVRELRRQVEKAPATEASGERGRNLLVGVGFVLALAAFALGLRNSLRGEKAP
jgi:cobalt/nickel transport system permease protein